MFSPYIYQSKSYDLSHLNSFEYVFIQSATDKAPQRKYKVFVEFSNHCFTSGTGTDSNSDREYRYRDSERNPRFFDFARYELSKNLPEIIKGLNTRICFQTKNVTRNFFTVEIYDNNGEPIEYEIYFSVYKTPKLGKKNLKLHIDSAFPRDNNNPLYQTRPKKGKKINFLTILALKRAGKKIQP